MTDAALVTSATHGRVRVLTLNRPEARNALSAALREQLKRALADAVADEAVGAIVLTGAGTAFAAGADLRELAARSPDEQRAFLQPPHIYSVVEDAPKPVLAAIQGHALGAGLELATACDMRIAHPRAKLGQPEIQLALLPGGGGVPRLVRLVGSGAAARLVLTGEPVDAAEALRLGLVDEVADDPLARCLEVAALMARHDAGAVGEAKAALRAAAAMPYAAALEHGIEAFVRLHARPPSRERIRKFLEKPR